MKRIISGFQLSKMATILKIYPCNIMYMNLSKLQIIIHHVRKYIYTVVPPFYGQIYIQARVL